jgi:hypothetical protein
MRPFVRILAGIVAMIAAWWVTGMIAVNLPSQRDLGSVFMAFLVIGPIGGLVGLVAGIWLFNRLTRRPARRQS